MMEVLYFDPRDGKEHSVTVDGVHLWEAYGGGPEHPDGTVIEGYRDGSGVLQLDVNERRGRVHILESKPSVADVAQGMISGLQKRLIEKTADLELAGDIFLRNKDQLEKLRAALKKALVGISGCDDVNCPEHGPRAEAEIARVLGGA